MTLIQHDHVVEQVAATCADRAFGHAILPGTSNGGLNRAYAETLQGLQNLRLKCVLAVEDQVSRRRIVRESLSKLLSDPGGRRMPCDVAVEDVAPVVTNDEEAVEHAASES